MGQEKASSGHESIQLLRVHGSSRGLDEQQLRLLAGHAELVRYREGDVLQQAGEYVNALLLIVNGRLKMSAVGPGGGERPILYLGRDDQFGLLSLFEEVPTPIAVVANEPTTVLRIAKQSALQLIRDVPLWGRNLLQSLGPRLRETLLDDKCRRQPRVVGMIHVSPETRGFTSILARRLSGLGEEVGVCSDDKETLERVLGPSASLIDSHGALKSSEAIRSMIGQWSEAQRIIIDVHFDHVADEMTRLISACEAVFWFCASDFSARVVAELERLIQSSPKWRDKTYVVRMLQREEQVAPFVPKLHALCCQDFKVHGRDRHEARICTQAAGLERIVHCLRGISIGLALGGGAARGMSHLGVLQVLEEAQIPIDRMAGTSAGTLTGIVYAAGYSADFAIKAFAHDLKPAWYYRLLPYGDGWYMLGKYRRGGWDGMLRKYLHSWRIEQLPIPFSAVAADLVQARQVIRDKGDAVHGLLESINLPFLSRPICRDGAALVDGGVLNVVPADVLVNQGANIVIAVDVSAKIRFEFAGNRPDTPTEDMKIPTTAQTTVRVRTIQDRNIRSIGGGAADLVIEPDVSEVELSDFKRAAEIAKLGRSAAEAALPELREILTRMDPQLFART